MELRVEIQRVLNGWVADQPRAKAKKKKGPMVGLKDRENSHSKLARILVWGGEGEPSTLRQTLGNLADWQWQDFKVQKKPVVSWPQEHGLSFCVRPLIVGADEPRGGHDGHLESGAFVLGRDTLGQAVAQAIEWGAQQIEIDFHRCAAELIRGAVLGMEVAAYQYLRVSQTKEWSAPTVSIRQEGEILSDLSEPLKLARAVNLARHLTNLPPNRLNPEAYCEIAKQLFSRAGSEVQLDIWNETRLKKERCNLILAVGAGSDTEPALIHIKYRPRGVKAGSTTFVGKGVTFDSGGLNLKPDSGMRLMKKDMGGSAAVLALAWWAIQSKVKKPCDFILGLAENSVDGRSYRPSDVIESRAGLKVEIHNTDAEGRLVLADALDHACDLKPELIVDVATLTGAIKAGLGSQVAGLFGNDDERIQKMMKSAKKTGDWMWPMPLYRKYKSALRSQFADVVNSGDGFGGAITAALFLEKFVRGISWLHLDIYGWKDSAEGCFSEGGASGQSVLALADFLSQKSK